MNNDISVENRGEQGIFFGMIATQKLKGPKSEKED